MHEILKVLPREATILCERIAEVRVLDSPEFHSFDIYFRINVKLGGTNVVAEPQDISFLTDSANPAMIMGRSRSLSPFGTQLDSGTIHSQARTSLTHPPVPKVAHHSLPSLEVWIAMGRNMFQGSQCSNPRRSSSRTWRRCLRCVVVLPNCPENKWSLSGRQDIFGEYRAAMGKFPKRILFYRGR